MQKMDIKLIKLEKTERDAGRGFERSIDAFAGQGDEASFAP